MKENIGNNGSTAQLSNSKVSKTKDPTKIFIQDSIYVEELDKPKTQIQEPN